MDDILNRKLYSNVIKLPTFEERFEYLKLRGKVANETFGWDRYLNQALYTSKEWRSFRNKIIIRDNGCDLACLDRPIFSMIEIEPGHYTKRREKILIHHINPITPEELEQRSPAIFDPENVICVSHKTHQAIHYGDEAILPKDPIIRRPNDTCPWK